MKILIKPNKDIEEYKNIDGVILPLKDFSTDYDVYYTLEEIKNIKEKYNYEIFVVINKMIFNKDIELLKETLIKLDKIGLNGLFFYDLSILKLKEELELNLDLVWNNTFMVTNYETCNYYNKKGVKYAVLSNEITLKEALEVKEKSSMILMFNLITLPTVANSYRSFITNYNKNYNYDSGKKLEILEKVTDEKYLVLEDKLGTTFKYGKVLNNIEALEKLKEVDFPYIILNEDFIEHDIFIKVLDIITSGKNIEEVYKLIGDNTGFLNKETIYKVKKNG